MDTLVATQAHVRQQPELCGLLRQQRPVLLHQRRHAGLRQSQRAAEGGQSLRRFPPAAANGGLLLGFFLAWDSSRERWDGLSPDRPDGALECESDRGVDGDGSAGEKLRGQRQRGPLGRTDASEPAWTTQYTVYDGNWLNWRSNPPTVAEVAPRDRQGRQSTPSWPGSADVNVGVMRFNGDEGGAMVAALEDIETSRDSVTAIVNALNATGQHAAVRDAVRGSPGVPGRRRGLRQRRAHQERGGVPGGQHHRFTPVPLAHRRNPAARTTSSCSRTASPRPTPARSARSRPCRTSARSWAPPATAAAKAGASTTWPPISCART